MSAFYALGRGRVSASLGVRQSRTAGRKPTAYPGKTCPRRITPGAAGLRSWSRRLKELLWSGKAVDRQEFWREREAAYRAELSLDPSLKHIWVQYGHTLKEQGQLDAAEQAYRRSLALDETLADTNLQLGHV